MLRFFLKHQNTHSPQTPTRTTLAHSTQSSNNTHIANLTTAHYHLIYIKHHSYPNTVNYYLDSTKSRLSKTKTIQLRQLNRLGLGEAVVGVLFNTSFTFSKTLYLYILNVSIARRACRDA